MHKVGGVGVVRQVSQLLRRAPRALVTRAAEGACFAEPATAGAAHAQGRLAWSSIMNTKMPSCTQDSSFSYSIRKLAASVSVEQQMKRRILVELSGDAISSPVSAFCSLSPTASR